MPRRIPRKGWSSSRRRFARCWPTPATNATASRSTDPRTDAPGVAKKGPINIEEGRKHWAYQLPKKPQPPQVKDVAWPRNDIDRFILAKLEEKNLKPVAFADLVTLVRRIYFDLIGLPPTPEQVDDFVRDCQSAIGNRQSAIERLVDRLLASPRFGERWGRHW
ncbi:MAG: DUF1549 domain-containing protein, partial [Verrucomicrobia bacterium]|nr:DUF1549 domain-containing protein [Verrucomicrobiota bacterium]